LPSDYRINDVPFFFVKPVSPKLILLTKYRKKMCILSVHCNFVFVPQIRK
jgi:hypothetical protein